MLENALVAGITSLGVDVLVIGPLPTPALRTSPDRCALTLASFCPRRIMLIRTTASNFSGTTVTSWTTRSRKKSKPRFQRRDRFDSADGEQHWSSHRIDDALGRYVEFAKTSFPKGFSLEEMRVAVDVANGAAYKSSPCVLRELGAEVAVAHNDRTGSTLTTAAAACTPMRSSASSKSAALMSESVTTAMPSRSGFATRTARSSMGDEILAIAALDFWNPAGWSKTPSWHGHEQFRFG